MGNHGNRKVALLLTLYSLILTGSRGLKLGPDIAKVDELATKQMIASISGLMRNLARFTENRNSICVDEINRIRNAICAKCAGTPVVPSLSEIKENLNRPLTKLLSLFFDVLDALTLERVEQVGERKYMMEEDFRITAKHLKAATRPELGKTPEESNRIWKNIDEKLEKVINNFKAVGSTTGRRRRRRRTRTGVIRTCSHCASLDGVSTAEYIDKVCGPASLSVDSVMGYLDKYRVIFNTTFGYYDPFIQEVEFDESTVSYQLAPFIFQAEIISYKYRIQDTVLTQESISTPLYFSNLNTTAIDLANEILQKHAL
ncbi:uncharacterized protein LOC125670530 [Ostrea edulis]|uniref:uncharacterized protein LOC125670530 n=1 Tax=Ostrea edulis TaxID=37623 RepID=UPI0024AECFF1|nr:uncharacterized protein LOC125670530 [Ostrea edulis]XP_056019585.1 uncharacterized protein LOC125670530 [Ostrea edulis]